MSRPTFAWLILLAALSSARAGEGWETKPYGLPGHLLPWNRPGYQGYTETAKPPPPPPVVSAAPERYTITIARLPHKPQDVDPNVVVLMAHLPEHAQVWFNDKLTKTQGKVRYFESPPLTPGKQYLYTMRVTWYENDKWVHKTEKVPVEAGELRCVYLMPANIAENLAKLSAEDRRFAEAQSVCPITGDPLGVLGVPAKITLKGQPVLLCCKDCIEKAKAEPDKTLAKIKAMKEKAGSSQKQR
ncbi:MAG TPA: TIGR03000 domain-containing protein [Gemmataceae bacterium]|nr:TIGR03000 domain-containing protein [Gemmataceae bacterium]